MKSLLIDIGSTNIKYCELLCQVKGTVQKIPFPSKLKSLDPFYEVDAEKILEIVTKIIRSSDASRVLISTQMHGWLLGGKNGILLTNYVSWRDSRAKLYPYPFHLSAEYGVREKPNLPRFSVIVTQKLFPYLAANVKEFFTLGSFIIFRLTGKNCTHITDAASSGYYNVKTCIPLSCGLGLPTAFKEIRPVGIFEGKVVFTPIGDQQCSVLGAGGDENMYILNMGTAAQMCAISPRFVAGEFESRPYFEGKTLCTVTGLCGGAYLRNNAENKNIGDILYRDFVASIAKLPKRNKIMVIGGVLNYYKEIVMDALSRLNIPITINSIEDALTGLKIISEEEIDGKEERHYAE